MTRFAMIGFGEVGGIFARDLRVAGAEAIHAFDIAAPARDRAAAAGATLHNSAAEAAAQAEVVIVPVTAGSALAAAQSLAGGLGHAPFVMDVNSVSPGTKQASARAVTEAGGRYVEAAVMASVPPKGLRSPILLGGPEAEAFKALMVRHGPDPLPRPDRQGLGR
jgi:3-hydroxyisobutyrate dehydrogenase-like beta-hydroxyacid dehydrogenase